MCGPVSNIQVLHFSFIVINQQSTAIIISKCMLVVCKLLNFKLHACRFFAWKCILWYRHFRITIWNSSKVFKLLDSDVLWKIIYSQGRSAINHSIRNEFELVTLQNVLLHLNFARICFERINWMDLLNNTYKFETTVRKYEVTTNAEQRIFHSVEHVYCTVMK